LIVSAVAVAIGFALPARADSGWTNLSPAAGARVVYVSSSAGSDSNGGLSASAPVRSLAKGYSLLRDGNPDWMVLRSGDTWNETFPSWSKSANSNSQYMVVASYGVGPRPRIVAPVNETLFYSGGDTPRRGLALLDLDLSPAAGGSHESGIMLLNVWQHVLIEGCKVIGFSDNIVIEDVNFERQSDIKIRRCIIADSNNAGPTGHSQGIFMRCVDNWVIEGCVLDYNGRTRNTIFCHNVYIHETCGAGVFNENISARASSHGVQQRPGGQMVNNLFLQNSINAYQGSAAGVPNVFRFNVVLDSKDVNPVDARGWGFICSGNTTVEYNVAAHQESGTGLGTVRAFDFDGVSSAVVRGNFVYDWRRPGEGDGSSYHWGEGAGTVLFENNYANQPMGGMCVRHVERSLSSSFTYRNNKYWTINPFGGYWGFATAYNAQVNWDVWRAQANETGTTFANPGQLDVRIERYLMSLNMTGFVPGFMANARSQSKLNWHPQFTSAVVNDWVRARVGLPLVGGNGGTPICYANCDASTGSPLLTGADFLCFMNKYVAQDPSANCDGSLTPPVLTANDFMCFMDKYMTGCP